jgi:hypothetical protein
MKIPNAPRAHISRAQLVEYLLHPTHPRGSAKAQRLSRVGYRPDTWHRLVHDLHRFHLPHEVDVVRQTPYGTRYEIHAAVETPSGRRLTLRSIWQMEEGTDVPCFLTLVPD